MNSSKESLDNAFQKMVIQMKPYVLQNTNVKESRFIRAWIKKLCNEAIYSIAERKNRNLYALLLLTMLHDGSLDEPFTTLPTDGVLPTIPAYIVDHLNSIDVNKKKIGLEPSWLHEDSLLQDSLLSIENNLLVYKDIFSPQKRERFMLSSHFLLKKNQLNENVKQAGVFKSKFSNTNNENESHSFLDEDLEINNIKTEYHVRNIKKSSKINALHKTEVVELKDNEITDVKKFYEAKIEELEKINKGLESKISALNEELSTLKSANRHAIESLKKSEEKAAETEKEFEKILCDKLSGFELEMYKLQCSHRENIHQLVNEAEGKINSIKYIMEKDSSLLKEEIKKCNERLNSQTQFNETIERENYKYRHEQQEYKDIMEKQRIQIEEYNIKLQQQKNQAQEQEKLHQKFIDELNTKNEHILNLQKEQDLQILKKSSAISSLEAELVLLKETIELMKSNEKESKVSTHQEVVKLQCAHQQQMLLIKNELGNKLLEYENKLKKSDLLIIEKDEEIKRLLTNIDSHVNESNEAIESFKKKAEEDSANMFKELSIQLEVLQTSLRSARQKIEDNKVEFTKRLDEQRSMYEKQILSYKESFEFEKCQLKQQYDEQRSNLLKQIENQSNLQEQFLKSWKEEESKYKDQNDKHQKTIEEMESQVRSLRVEVIQANTLRKEQIVEIGLLRKEEQEAARRNEEALHSKYKNEIDEINLRLQKEHSIQLNLFTKKMNEQLRNIENEYSKKTAEDHNKIASLREELSAANKKAGEYEKQLQECMEMVSDERKKFSEYQNQSLLKREEMEEHYQNMLMKSDENLFCCRQEYENKLKGMLSSSVQQDLEDTISALREQLQIMQAHIDILQAELDVNEVKK
ncbi:centrosomal protein of 112 kDa isoform X4 [Hydra vulgaris]|uniref:Centrosomal protein of 112 kDa isoform X4 n=1 Tax=Hydra vulgaris TaxID=6087 RepID=A0ABM4CCB4_HYDVU